MLNFEFDDPRCTFEYIKLSPQGDQLSTIDVGDIAFIRPMTHEEAGMATDDPHAVIAEGNYDRRQDPDLIFTNTPLSEFLSQIPPLFDVGGRFVPAAVVRNITTNTEKHFMRDGKLHRYQSVIDILSDELGLALYSEVPAEELLRRYQVAVNEFAQRGFAQEDMPESAAQQTQNSGFYGVPEIEL
ncbi:MAG: hypothetical protein B7Z29_08150 [Hyphomicrobium sp. 12-62-95]|nr:MAG: hypothetical protein B7Z29_08150 [Hyphomicrobium sp. 12-62-95]